MNRTIQNPKRVSIIVDSETLRKVRELIGISGISFSFFVRSAMDDFVDAWGDADPNQLTFFTRYRYRGPQEISPRGKGGKNV
jgi:hypothetical protein